MSNISTPKGAGKEIPLPKSETTENADAAAAPEELEVGDLVELTFDTKLCQVITIDDQAVVVAPLLDFEDGKRFEPHERTAVHLHEVRKIPSPVIKTNWRQMRTQRNPDAMPKTLNSDQLRELRSDFCFRATTRAAINEQSEREAYQGETPHEAKVQHQHLLADAIAAFEIAHSLWHDLAHSADADGYTLAWWDHVHIANSDALIQAARAELYEVFASVSGSIGIDATFDRRVAAMNAQAPAEPAPGESGGKVRGGRVVTKKRNGRRKSSLICVANRQLEAAAPTIEAMAAAYQMLVADGWNEYFRRRHRHGLLAYDSQQIIEATEATKEGVRHNLTPYLRRAGGNRLLRLILKHHHDRPMLMALAGAFLIEQVRRGGSHE